MLAPSFLYIHSFDNLELSRCQAWQLSSDRADVDNCLHTKFTLRWNDRH